MKKIPLERYAGRLCRTCALLTMCAMLTSCVGINLNINGVKLSMHPLDLQPKISVQESISIWRAAGSPPVVWCDHPFMNKNPGYSESMGTQAYTSMREFSQAVEAAQAPVVGCIAAGGNDTAPDDAQIAGMYWGYLGYIPFSAWQHATVEVYKETAHLTSGYVDNYVCQDNYNYDGSRACSWEKTFEANAGYEIKTEDQSTPAFIRGYLVYPLISQEDEQVKRKGVGVYAMQGFSCAIRLHDFPAARRYWALALSANPKLTPDYAQNALQSFFQSLPQHIEAAGEYLKIPEDIRIAVWNSASRKSYYGVGGKRFSMAQIEKAARTETLFGLLVKRVQTPSYLHCPAFYPDFYSLSSAHDNVDHETYSYRINFSTLKNAADKADKEAKQAGEGSTK
jgi:hypothetical protein